MKPLIIFDLDGTLVDSLPDIAWALNKALREHQLDTYDEATIKTFIGSGTKVLLERAAKNEVPSTLLERYQTNYNNYLVRFTRIYPGVLELLESLSEANLVVFTNKYQTASNVIIDHFFPGIFKTVLGDGTHPRKPDPTGVFELMRLYCATKETTILVGDSRVDEETAKAAGIEFVAVDWGYDPVEGAVDLADLTKRLKQFLLRGEKFREE